MWVYISLRKPRTTSCHRPAGLELLSLLRVPRYYVTMCDLHILTQKKRKMVHMEKEKEKKVVK